MPDGPTPILVTGLPRSGTSWVGKMLEASGRLVYINEPMNPRHPPGLSPGILAGPDPVPYQYIDRHNADQWEEPVRRMLALRYGIAAELRRNRSPYDILRLLKYVFAFYDGRLRGRRALVDDPYALMAVRWLTQELGISAVVLIREPRSYVGSRVNLGWRAGPERVAGQPELMSALWDGHEGLILGALNEEDEVVKTAALWAAVYDAVDRVYRTLPGVSVVTYESLARRPVPGFTELYEKLSLPMTARSRARIERATTSTGGAHRAFRWSGTSRTAFQPMDSAAHLESYRQRLTLEQIFRIDEVTREVRDRFYPDPPP